MMIVINEDNDNFFKYPSQYMTRESLEKYIDFYAATCATHFFMCPNGQRTSYRSNVHEAIWEELPGNVIPDNIWPVNAKKLFDQGINPYQVWISRCREKGISPWISMRMNDVHFTDNFNYFRVTNFHRYHPELHRLPPEESKSWDDYAFDYSKQEVYDYHMALVKELVDIYDVDGYEFDWLRWPCCFSPNKEEEQKHILTQFIAESRAYIDKVRGKEVKLGVRVYSTPEYTTGCGFDIVNWVKEAGVSLITASGFYNSIEPEFSIRQWKDFLGDAGKDVIILPATDHGSAPAPSLPRTPLSAADFRGWADVVLSDGFPGIYFFNIPYSLREEQELPQMPEDAIGKMLMTEDFSPEALAAKERRYVVSYREPAYFRPPELIQLPAALPAKLNIRTGNAAASGKVTIQIALRNKSAASFWMPDPNAAEVTEVLLNGVKCPFTRQNGNIIANADENTKLQKRNIIEIKGSSSLEVISAAISVRP